MVNQLAEWLNRNHTKNHSRSIWAFDPMLDTDHVFEIGTSILDEIAPFIVGVKLDRHLVLPYGLKSADLRTFIQRIHSYDLPVIMDEKINAIGYTNYSIAYNCFSAGFDAVIAAPFVGWDGGLDQVFSAAEKFNKDVLLLVYMTHKDANFGYSRIVTLGTKSTPFYNIFANCVNEWNTAGAIVGATYPSIIQEVRNILPESKLILSPGIGIQGGDMLMARKAGMDYGIIGRSITENIERKNFLLELSKVN